MNAINMCDMMILVIDAMSGIGPGTIRAWNQARDRQMPRMIFINGCDRDQVNIEGTLENVVNSYGKTVCIPCTIPDGSAATFKGVHSVLAEDAPAEAEDYKVFNGGHDRDWWKYWFSEELKRRFPYE